LDPVLASKLGLELDPVVQLELDPVVLLELELEFLKENLERKRLEPGSNWKLIAGFGLG
jgi:hypothetical protein